MKYLLVLVLMLNGLASFAQYGNNTYGNNYGGYNYGNNNYGNSGYSNPFANTNTVNVNGYYRNNGTYVQPYIRTVPNNVQYDNYSYMPRY